MTRFIDTNMFLRYLTHPDTDEQRRKHEASSALIQQVESGDEEAVTTESVFAEIMFVFCSRRQYGLDRAQGVDLVRPLIEMPSLELTGKSTYLRAMDLFCTYSQLDIEDAISAAFMERHGIAEIWSFDHDFDNIPGIVRVEPDVL
ncbi:MAG: type II toxin-antitoxin system VapC family toxin [Chloroflexota bacterium]